MPRRGSSYGSNYGGNHSYLYESLAQEPAWLSGIDSAVGAFITARQAKQARSDAKADKQDQWDNEFRKANAAASANIAMANAGIVAIDQEREAKAKADEEARVRSRVMSELVGKALGGDRSALGQVIAGGAPAGTVSAIERIGFKPPEAGKPSTYQTAYDRQKAIFDAKREAGVPLYTPPRAGSGSAPVPNKAAIATEAARIAAFKEKLALHNKSAPGPDASPEQIAAWQARKAALGDSIVAHVDKRVDLIAGQPEEDAAQAQAQANEQRNAKKAALQEEMQALGQHVASVLQDRSMTMASKDRARAMLARENARIAKELNALR